MNDFTTTDYFVVGTSDVVPQLTSELSVAASRRIRLNLGGIIVAKLCDSFGLRDIVTSLGIDVLTLLLQTWHWGLKN